MTDVIHPAVNYDYPTLISNLDVRVANGYVNRVAGPDGLVLYNYTNACVYDKAWDEFTLIARGLIIDTINHRIAALSFPKFFNYGEGGAVVPDLPFEAHEKMDGSLIIAFYHNNKWMTATRGSFKSDQAVWANSVLNSLDTDRLDKTDTYLFEAIYAANRIVVKYPYEGLVLLGGYMQSGEELYPYTLQDLANDLNIKLAFSYKFDSFADILSIAPTLTRNEEGFVVRFSNGLRLKIKGDEYKRIHRMVSNLSPLSIWESMLAKSDLIAIRKELPEEFWDDFDKILNILQNRYAEIASKVVEYSEQSAKLSNKEIGLDKNIPSDMKSYIFNIRNGREDKNHEKIMNAIRPTGNYLDGYSASNSLKEAQADS